MFEKLEELAKNNKKISDFHIRSGSPLAYRQTGEIIKVQDVMVKAQDLQDLISTNCNEVETKRQIPKKIKFNVGVVYTMNLIKWLMNVVDIKVET